MSEANEPAFPTSRYLPNPEGGYLDIGHYEPVPAGLTKRELFAAMAMQGIIGQAWHPAMGCDPYCEPTKTAEAAVGFADALLAELAKQKAE